MVGVLRFAVCVKQFYWDGKGWQRYELEHFVVTEIWYCKNYLPFWEMVLSYFCLFVFCVCYWCDSPPWARASSLTRFLDHTQRRRTVGLLWASDQLVAETSTWQHTTLTTEKRPCPRWDSNPQPQQASGRRHTPETARPPGPASFVTLQNLIQHKCLQITNASKISTTC